MNSNYFVALRLLLCDFCNPFQKRSNSRQAELGLEHEVLLGFIFLRQTRAYMLASNTGFGRFWLRNQNRMCDERTR